jgi:hypothetical protein
MKGVERKDSACHMDMSKVTPLPFNYEGGRKYPVVDVSKVTPLLHLCVYRGGRTHPCL